MRDFFGYELCFFPPLSESRWLKPIGYIANAIKTLTYLIRKRPEVVFIQLAPTFLLYVAMLYQRLSRQPVLVIADCHNSMFRDKWLRFPGARSGLANCHRVLVHNDRVLERAQSLGLLTPPLQKLETRPASIDTAKFDQPMADFATGSYVLMPCSFDADEPIDVVIDAARQAPDLNFVLTGNPQRWHKNIDDVDLPQNLRLSGYVSRDDLNRLVCNAQMLLGLTLRDDIQLSVANEALGAQKPMVLSDTPLLRSIFRETPEYVETTSAQSIITGCRRVRDALPDYTERSRAAQIRRESEWRNQAETLQQSMQANTTDD